MTRLTVPSAVYAYSNAQELLDLIPICDSLECDMGAISVAFVRHCKGTNMVGGHFDVRGIPFPASNFSSNILILTPLVREVDGKPTLRPLAAFLREHGITHLRIVGSGAWNRQHEFSRNGGRTWGKMPSSEAAPAAPAPTVVIDAPIPASPATDDDEPF